MGSSLAIKGGILLVAVFLILKFGLPLITAPLPMSLIWLYLFLTIIGIIVFGTLSGQSTEALLGPIFRFLGAPPRSRDWLCSRSSRCLSAGRPTAASCHAPSLRLRTARSIRRHRANSSGCRIPFRIHLRM
jgi:hypothetical protein